MNESMPAPLWSESGGILEGRPVLEQSVPSDLPNANRQGAVVGGQWTFGADGCIIVRDDGVYVDPMAQGATLVAAVNDVFLDGKYFSKLDYQVFMKVLFDCGPSLPRSTTGEALVQLADHVVELSPARRDLYKSVKIVDGGAEYYFEPVYLPDPDTTDGGVTPALLDFDEFVAVMWSKSIRFGLDVPTVRQAIEHGQAGRFVVARRMEAVPGKDAAIIEVSDHLHRSNAPRQLASGKLDIMSFQNRFPQIDKGERLLRKVPREAGMLGYELDGASIEPPIPADVALGPMVGAGTVIEVTGEGEFLVALKAGFLNVDSASGQLSVEDKIVSQEGVSSRTTGNLHLTGDYEEYGEVQEMRVLEGENITIHADVFGNIISRGGTILLERNLVGGTAHNAAGDIAVKGIASNAMLQTRDGQVTIGHAEGCTISATRVTIDHATNCEIIAEEVTINLAEGCTIAARKVCIESAGPRKQSEMLVYMLLPDSSKIDEIIGLVTARIDELGTTVEALKLETEKLTQLPDVNSYLTLASKIRKKELMLSPEQVTQFQKLVLAVQKALSVLAKISLQVKSAEAAQQAAREEVARLAQQKLENGSGCELSIGVVTGETLVRSMSFDPNNKRVYDMSSIDIKTLLRSCSAIGEIIFSGGSGTIEWRFNV